MTAPTAQAAPAAPWLLPHATACAEAVATALDLLDGDEVETLPDAAGDGFTLKVHADPPRAVRALHWSTARGWDVTADPALRRPPRWRPLAVEADADPIVLCEVLRRGT
ncbi:hypothetical protein [Actinomycetospora aeridis]|uniref:Aminoglycoside phosphotransferase n=1 Tax=Actinomycetospora aeridis TaxID=3129231 RepID=A0ABU8N9Q1_9PSEU